MVRFCPVDEAVASCIKPGCTAAFEGFTHLIPFAAAHAVIRQGISNLTLVRMTPDIIYDQMIGAGLVSKLVFSYAGNPGVGLLHRLRDAVECDWPGPLQLVEHSHAALASAYDAGASRLPFAVFRGYIGTDYDKINDQIRKIECPFTGEMLAAVPAINPDVAVIHAQKADRHGNVLIEGIIGAQKQVVLAANRAIVTVEQIVDDLDSHYNACVLPHWTIECISRVPGGAHPSYVQGHYSRDNRFYIEWNRISSDRERFLDWIDEFVMNSSSTDFHARAIPGES